MDPLTRASELQPHDLADRVDHTPARHALQRAMNGAPARSRTGRRVAWGVGGGLFAGGAAATVAAIVVGGTVVGGSVVAGDFVAPAAASASELLEQAAITTEGSDPTIPAGSALQISEVWEQLIAVGAPGSIYEGGFSGVRTGVAGAAVNELRWVGHLRPRRRSG